MFYGRDVPKLAFGVSIDLSTSKYRIKKCNTTFKEKLNNVPDTNEKTWFVQRNNTGLLLKCDEMVALWMEFSSIHENNCRERIRDWDITHVKVTYYDNATTLININKSIIQKLFYR